MIEKRINGGNYQPTLTDKIVLDSTPTVNSLNGVTSDAVARAVAGASGEVPQVTESDNGKVLSAIYDAGGPAVEWADAPSGLPDTTGASQGDVLSIGSSGPEWAAPSGGGASVTAGDGIAVDNNKVSLFAKPNDGLSFGYPSYTSSNFTMMYPRYTQFYSFFPAEPRGESIATETNSGFTFTYSPEQEGCKLRLFLATSQFSAFGHIAYLGTTNLKSSGVDIVCSGNSVTVASAISDYGTWESRWTALGTDAWNTITYIGIVPVDENGDIVGNPVALDNASLGTKFTMTSMSSQWLQLDNPVPAYAAGDAGKVLQVQNDGTLAWVTLS